MTVMKTKNIKTPQPKKSEASIFIGGIPQTSLESDIVCHFSRFGKIDSVTLPKDLKGRLKGFALVHFCASASANKALKVKEDKLKGKFISIAPCLDSVEAEKIRDEAENLKIFVKGLTTATATSEASIR